MNARVAEWQTRTTQNRVRKLMWVQLPPWAPKQNSTAFSKPEGGTREARGGLKLPRTLVSFRHCLASLGNPKKKKSSLLFGFARDQFFLKMERTFFFLGFCLPSIQAGGGTMRTKFWQNYFLGKGFAKTSADSFLN